MVQAVYEREINVATQAQFLLVSIQMISEAARFKYIEGQVLYNFRVGFTPDYKVPNLEDKWGKISKAIFEANKEGKFNSALELKDERNQDWKVTEVKQIAPDVSLLCYIEAEKFEGPSFFTRIPQSFDASINYGNATDHVD